MPVVTSCVITAEPVNLEGYIFKKKFFTIKKYLEWTSGFHAIDDLPRAH